MTIQNVVPMTEFVFERVEKVVGNKRKRWLPALSPFLGNKILDPFTICISINLTHHLLGKGRKHCGKRRRVYLSAILLSFLTRWTEFFFSTLYHRRKSLTSRNWNVCKVQNKYDSETEIVSLRVENIVGIEEYAGNLHFLLFPQCFWKGFSPRVNRSQDCVAKV